MLLINQANFKHLLKKPNMHYKKGEKKGNTSHYKILVCIDKVFLSEIFLSVS